MVQTLDAPRTLGAMPRKPILWAAAAFLAAAGAFAAGTAWGSPTTPVVKVTIGGPASSVENSTGLPPGQDISGLGEARVSVVAAGDEKVICRITVGGSPVSEATAAGKGQAATCYWKR